MQGALAEEFPGWEEAVKNMVTEDHEPVESFFVEKQMRILVDALLSSWQPQPFEDAPEEPRPFIAACNVGIFTTPYQPAVVPDMFLSLDVKQEAEDNSKESHSYCLWIHEKPPEVVVEIISDKRGDEFGAKMNRYGRMGVRYYVTFDPRGVYDEPFVRVYERSIGWRYRLREDLTLPEMGLSLTLWRGEYQGMNEEFLRWCDLQGNLILTGKELAQAEMQRANTEMQRANAEAQRANAEAQRANAEAQRANAAMQRAGAEAEARRQAEAEVERLKAELARLRGESK